MVAGRREKYKILSSHSGPKLLERKTDEDKKIKCVVCGDQRRHGDRVGLVLWDNHEGRSTRQVERYQKDY